MSHYVLKKKIEAKIKPIMDHLDPEAQQIAQDLLKRLRPFKHIVPNDPFIDKELPGTLCVIGTDGGVAFTPHDLTDEERWGTSLIHMEKEQFATFTETRQFCEGTEGLLEILTRYHRISTDKATIWAYPDVHVFIKNKAVWREEDREEYGDTRCVKVVFKSAHGTIMFGFQEKVDKNNKVREQKVY